jgi:hypothetical protein
MQLYGFDQEEARYLKTMDAPGKVQDFLDTLKYNGSYLYVCKSPRTLIRLPAEQRFAHCLEGALVAAAIRRINGHPPLVMELAALDESYHFISPFKENGLWGAMAYSSTFSLKWRNPIYRNIRELALSYFETYIDNDMHTLRTYSEPVDISLFDDINWMSSENCVGEIGEKFDEVHHFKLFNPSIELRPAEVGFEQQLINHKSHGANSI